MSRGVFVIGVGGSGQNTLIFLKERLIETYGKVPDSVVLLSLDTAAPEAGMSIGGINLNLKGVQQVSVQTDKGSGQVELVEQFLGRERELVEKDRAAEFHPMITDRGKNVDSILQDVTMGKAPHFADWVEVEPLTGLPPAQKAIAAGAGQRRPLGRIALFLDYPRLYAEILNGFSRLFKTPPFKGDRHNVFVVGSVAGGTGSGGFLDVLNIIAKVISDNQNYQQSTLAACVILPSAFQDNSSIQDRSNLQPNSYAALRELDRFQQVHSNTRPTLVRYGTDLQHIKWVTSRLASHVYLVDTNVPGAGGQTVSDPRRTVFPAIADFIAAKVTDPRLPDGTTGGGGLMIEALENNFDVILNDRTLGRQYLGLNTFTYIVPINDIIRALSFRYLHEMHERLFGDPSSSAQAAAVKQSAAEQVEGSFINLKIAALNRLYAPEETAVPALMRAAVKATRVKDPDLIGVDWENLLRLLARTPEEYEDDRKALQQALDYIESELVNTQQYSRREGYKESFEEGADRLKRMAGSMLDKFLGPQTSLNDSQSRVRGEWNMRLAKYDELEDMFGKALDFAVRNELNRRDEQGKLLPNRLAAARAFLDNARDRLKIVARQMETNLAGTGAPQRYADLITEEIKARQADMEDSASDLFVPLLVEKPLRMQKAYIDAMVEYLQLELSLRLFARVRRTLDIFGVEDAYERIDDEGRAHKEPSIVARGLSSLDNWNQTLREADKILEEARKRHEVERRDKTRIEVRRYLTDAEYENKIYEMCLKNLDAQLQGKGADGATPQLHWSPKRLPEDTGDEPSLILELLLAWAPKRGVGPVDLATYWMTGAHQSIEKIVRDGVTVVNRLFQLPDFKDNPDRLATAIDQRVARPLLRHTADNVLTYRVLTFPFRGQKAAQEFTQKVAGYWKDIDAQRKLDPRTQLEDGECAASMTTISFSGAAAMTEVEQFQSSEATYRQKIGRNEPVHIFPEEQQAVKMEQSTSSVFPRQATPRTLSPEVVVCMADKRKLEVFAAGCAYEVIRAETVDPTAATPHTEIFVSLLGPSGPVRLQLSHSKLMDGVAPGQLPSEGRLFLDALQQFCIVKTERIGMGDQIVQLVNKQIEGTLLQDPTAAKRPAEQILPFRLKLAEVERAISDKRKAMGPTLAEAENEPRKREQKNAQRSLDKIKSFKRDKLDKWMDSGDIKVQDLGIVLALLVQEMEQALQRQVES